MSSDTFVRFGSDHLLALGGVVLLGAAVAAFVRQASPSAARRLRLALAMAMVGGSAMEIGTGLAGGRATVEELMPLQLCDLSLLLGAWTLVTLSARTVEPLFFFALMGTLPALFFPELPPCGLGDGRFLAYFGLHGLTIVALLAVTAGAGVLPRPGGWWRALLWINVIAAAVSIVNVAAGTNYMYLRHKPTVPTPFDALGSGAWYAPSLELACVAVFLALELLAAGARRLQRAAALLPASDRGLLLGQAVQRAQAPDEVHGVDADHGPVGEQLGQRA